VFAPCAGAGFRRFGEIRLAGRIFSEKLFSASQNCRHDSRIAASVHGGENPQWFFLRRVGDQIIADQSEPQGPRGEVRTFMAPVGKGYQSIDSGQNLSDDRELSVSLRKNRFPYFLREIGQPESDGPPWYIQQGGTTGR